MKGAIDSDEAIETYNQLFYFLSHCFGFLAQLSAFVRAQHHTDSN